MLESLVVEDVIPGTPKQIYDAWLDSKGHAALTGGGSASVDPRPGGRFTAWDGYILGTTLELHPDRRIVQAWRTTEFPEGSPDSRLEVLLEPAEGGTRVTFRHSGIPEGQGPEYAQGWLDYYFEPMKRYFADMAA
jgi:activator of HSP90 ATPase